MSLLVLPHDVLTDIIDLCDDPTDLTGRTLASLRVVCRTLNQLASPIHYSRLVYMFGRPPADLDASSVLDVRRHCLRPSSQLVPYYIAHLTTLECYFHEYSIREFSAVCELLETCSRLRAVRIWESSRVQTRNSGSNVMLYERALTAVCRLTQLTDLHLDLREPDLRPACFRNLPQSLCRLRLGDLQNNPSQSRPGLAAPTANNRAASLRCLHLTRYDSRDERILWEYIKASTSIKGLRLGFTTKTIANVHDEPIDVTRLAGYFSSTIQSMAIYTISDNDMGARLPAIDFLNDCKQLRSLTIETDNCWVDGAGNGFPHMPRKFMDFDLQQLEHLAFRYSFRTLKSIYHFCGILAVALDASVGLPRLRRVDVQGYLATSNYFQHGEKVSCQRSPKYRELRSVCDRRNIKLDVAYSHKFPGR